MIDEGELRRRFPEIVWDEPVHLTISGHGEFWACRYCIAMHGLKAQDVIDGVVPEMAYTDRDFAKLHIDLVHHAP